jgi:catechol 2,3-dioxygenase-like lactoylglutathione lyase family enzyme
MPKRGRIALITILTHDVPTLSHFYRDVLGFRVEDDLGSYVELESEGVRFAICARSIMEKVTDHPSYKEPRAGQSFELAFPLDTPEEVDTAYAEVVASGATPICAPATMSWGHRTAFFADPDGNIHELFSPLPGTTE